MTKLEHFTVPQFQVFTRSFLVRPMYLHIYRDWWGIRTWLMIELAWLRIPNWDGDIGACRVLDIYNHKQVKLKISTVIYCKDRCECVQHASVVLYPKPHQCTKWDLIDGTIWVAFLSDPSISNIQHLEVFSVQKRAYKADTDLNYSKTSLKLVFLVFLNGTKLSRFLRAARSSLYWIPPYSISTHFSLCVKHLTDWMFEHMLHGSTNDLSSTFLAPQRCKRVIWVFTSSFILICLKSYE